MTLLRHAFCVEGVTQGERATIPVLGVGDDRIYGDHGLTSTIRQRTGLRLALAACWAGDTLVRDQRGDLLLSGAEVVGCPRSCGQGCLHFVPCGERQQAYPS